MSCRSSAVRRRIRAASFLAAAFVVLGGFALQGHLRAESYRRALDQSRHHAFFELTTAVEELDAALQKGLYATSPALFSSLCTDIFGKAMSAQMAIGELPYGSIELEQTAAFLARTGDYAMSLARSSAAGTPLDAQTRQTLHDLSRSASSLSALLQELRGDLSVGAGKLEDLEAVRARLSAAQSGTVAPGAFQSIEADFPEVPSLIYDGPFSEHLTGRSPKVLEGLAPVSEADARAAAAQVLQIPSSSLTLTSAGEGEIPTYGFSAQAEGAELYLELTRAGGVPVELVGSRYVSQTLLTDRQAVALAREFLARLGFDELVSTYTIRRDNILTVHFAAAQDGVVCYPDLIKVSTALDNGQVLGFEAAGYLMNHAPRSLPAPAVTPEQAQAVLDGELTPLAHALAVIPTGGEYEVFCHEFKCATPDGRHILVYVNAQTGQEEKILLLLEDENGTLTL